MKAYDSTKSIKENAEANNCSEATVRKYIQTRRIDRRGDEQIRKHQTITKLRKKGLSLRKIAEKTGYSVSTVQKYVNSKYRWQAHSDLTKESTFQRGVNSDFIKSVEPSQHDILLAILKLYIPSGIYDCDLTYSKGNFYKHLPKPLLRFDKYPQLDDVRPLEEAYGLKNGSIGSIVIDLPFIIRDSPSEESIINQRFKSFANVQEMISVYDEMMTLAVRLLSNEGLLIIKTQDVNSGCKQIWTHQIVERKAEELGLCIEDLFIFTSSHVMAQPTLSVQRHARKFHSYFYVLKKNSECK